MKDESADLLRAYLDASDAARAETALGELVSQRAEPLVEAIIRSKLSRSGPANLADVEDVCSEATVALISSLEDFRNSPGKEPLGDFEAFVAVIAYRACSAHFRQARPGFHRLRNRLRYLLETQPDLALWAGEGAEWWCGFERWRPQPGKLTPAPARLDPAEPSRPAASGNPAATVIEIFRRAGGPVPFDDLTRVMAQVWDVLDNPATVESVEVACPLPSAETGLERRQWTERLWREIGELPPKQRAALLLNLRDQAGESVTVLFAVTRVASLCKLAEAVEMTVEDFAEVWKDLPWSDLRIAERLGITRQQVINLRKCARERLARRMFGAKGDLSGAW